MSKAFMLKCTFGVPQKFPIFRFSWLDGFETKRLTSNCKEKRRKDEQDLKWNKFKVKQLLIWFSSRTLLSLLSKFITFLWKWMKLHDYTKINRGFLVKANTEIWQIDFCDNLHVLEQKFWHNFSKIPMFEDSKTPKKHLSFQKVMSHVPSIINTDYSLEDTQH